MNTDSLALSEAALDLAVGGGLTRALSMGGAAATCGAGTGALAGGPVGAIIGGVGGAVGGFIAGIFMSDQSQAKGPRTRTPLGPM